MVAWTGVGLGIVLWALFMLLSRFAGVLPYVVVAGLVVFVLNPAVRRLTVMGVPRRLAALLLFVGAVAITALLIRLLVPVLIDQAKSLAAQAPAYLRGGGLFDRLSRSSNPVLHQAGQTVSNWLAGHAGTAPQALETLTGAGLRLAHFGLVLLLGGFLGLLLLLSLPETGRALMALIPPARRAEVGPPLAEVRRLAAGYVRARLIVSAAVGILATLGLWIIHMPFWLVLGIIVGVANLIPMLGSIIGGIPVAIVAILSPSRPRISSWCWWSSWWPTPWTATCSRRSFSRRPPTCIR